MMTECEYEEDSTDKSVLINPTEKYSKVNIWAQK